MKQIKCTLSELDQINEVLFSLAHHRTSPILAVFSTEAQKKFYDLLCINLNYSNISGHTFEEFITGVDVSNKVVIILDIPANFQLMAQVVEKSQNSVELIMLLMKINKKYVNMLKKKVGNGQLQVIQTHYGDSKLIGINQKIKSFVNSNYDMNRAAFYAYGAYLNNFRANLLKFIFKTEDIDVNKLALSYGFNAAPRVKDGQFLKTQVRAEKNKQKQKQKRAQKKKEEEKSAEAEKTGKGGKMGGGNQGIKKLAELKTKKIMKKNKNKNDNEKSKSKSKNE